MSSAPAMHSDKTKARALAVVMHVLFIGLIVFGVTWQKKPPAPVVADLWSNLPPVAQPPQPQAAEPPPPEPPKPVARVTPPPVPKVEPAPAPKADIALKKKPEKEKKAEPKHETKTEPKADPKKREDEKLRREAREQEQQREAADKEAKAAAEKVATEKAAAERAARAASASEAQKYIAGIRSKVYSRVAVPPDLQGNPEAVFIVSLLPGGEVLSIEKSKSSGNDAYDAAIERAIRQAQPFNVPTGDDFHRNFRRLSLVFRPK